MAICVLKLAGMEEQIMENKKGNAAALLPILIFLVLYLGSGIYFEYINPVEGGMGFYIMSVVVSFVIALIVALGQNRQLTFDEKIHLCAQGIGDDNITIMLFIFLVAGAFSGIASASGGASSTAYMLLSIIPVEFAVPGIFIIACLISMAMGTSVGTITVLAPIAVAIAESTGHNLALCIGTVVGGAMFGDNLSFISDTTIAATKTQGVAMKDKFRANFKIALPAAAVTLVVLMLFSMNKGVASFDIESFNVLQTLPYFVVLVAAILGVNVFIALCGGTVLFFLVGLGTGSLTVASAFSAMGEGTNGMFETMVVAILVAAIAALIKENGGFDAILSFIKKSFHGLKGGMLGVGLLVLLMDIATANNTVAIVIAGPIAKNVSEDYGIEPRQTASLLDTFSCIGQGIIPYGAQLLIASGIAGISSLKIMPYLFYQFALLIAIILFIAFYKGAKFENDELPHPAVTK